MPWLHNTTLIYNNNNAEVIYWRLHRSYSSLSRRTRQGLPILNLDSNLKSFRLGNRCPWRLGWKPWSTLTRPGFEPRTCQWHNTLIDVLYSSARKFRLPNWQVLYPFADKEPRAAFKSIYKDIKSQYGAVILPESDLQWILLKFGGNTMSVCTLHASLTEYIIFIGSAVDTSGHSGERTPSGRSAVAQWSSTMLSSLISHDRFV